MSEPSLVLAIALAAGVLGQSLARHLRLPAIVVLLGFGVALGPDGLGWVQPSALGHGLLDIIDYGVAVVVFEGGLNLQFARLRREERPIRLLITLGAVITLAGATLAARLLLDWPWRIALLFGSLVVVTGPTVVTPLVRELRLRPRVRTILEAEGVLIDPIGAILSVVVLGIALVPAGDTVTSGLQYAASTFLMGGAAGAAGGLAIGGLLKLPRVVPEGLENVFTLAMVWLLFHACDLALAHSGLLAATIAGMIVGNMETPVDRDLREFKDQLTLLLVGVLFVLLAANMRLSSVVNLGWPGLVVVTLLMVVVRPLGAWVSTTRSGLSREERGFIAWIAPRGIVAAAVSSVAGLSLERAGIAGGSELAALVFLTIVMTVVVGGLTAHPLATWLAIRLPNRDRVAILGVNGLSLALGSALRDERVAVVFLDSDPRRCREAEERGLAVVFGDALAERTMARAQMDLVGTAIGATFNEHLNSLFTTGARQRFGVPLACVSLDAPAAHELRGHLELPGAEVLFGAPHDGERWDVRFRHGEAAVERFDFAGAPAEVAPDSGAATKEAPARRGPPTDPFAILTLRQGRHMRPMHGGLTPRPGDGATIALDLASGDEARAALERLGWRPAEVAPESGSARADAPLART